MLKVWHVESLEVVNDHVTNKIEKHLNDFWFIGRISHIYLRTTCTKCLLMVDYYCTVEFILVWKSVFLCLWNVKSNYSVVFDIRYWDEIVPVLNGLCMICTVLISLAKHFNHILLPLVAMQPTKVSVTTGQDLGPSVFRWQHMVFCDKWLCLHNVKEQFLFYFLSSTRCCQHFSFVFTWTLLLPLIFCPLTV